MIFFTTVLAFVIGLVSAQQRVAVAHFPSGTVTGTVTFTETDEGILVNGQIEGLEPNLYGFHIHELGDITTCIDTGSHFNPDGVNHGGREDNVRHVGDLGNVEFVVANNNSVANISFVDNVLALRGPNNILGRAVVVHEQEDDLGLGDDEGSLTTGNAGGRVACAVIGMAAPVDAWNSSIKVGSSTALIFVLLTLSNYFI